MEELKFEKDNIYELILKNRGKCDNLMQKYMEKK